LDWDVYKGKNTMQITKNQLRQIIQEELEQVLSEQNPRGDLDLDWTDALLPAKGLYKMGKYAFGDDPDPAIVDPRSGTVSTMPGGDSAPAQAVRKAVMKQKADINPQSPHNIRQKERDKEQGPGLNLGKGANAWCSPLLSRSQVLNVLKSNGLYTGPKWYKDLPYNHPARVRFRAWNKCAGGKPHRPDPKEAEAETETTEEGVCANDNVMHDAYAMYEALDGAGTDEEMVYQVLERNKDCACMKELYKAFDKLLQMKDDTDAGDLIDWLRDDGEYKAAAMVKKCMMGMDVRQIDTEWR